MHRRPARRPPHRATRKLGLLPRRRHQLRERRQDGPARRARRACSRSTAPSPRRSPARWPRARAPRPAPTARWRSPASPGPDGGTPEKPVGLVYVACAGRGRDPGGARFLSRRPRHGARVQRDGGAPPAARDTGRMSVAGAPATLRLFVAADIPRESRREIAAWQQRGPRRANRACASTTRCTSPWRFSGARVRIASSTSRGALRHPRAKPAVRDRGAALPARRGARRAWSCRSSMPTARSPGCRPTSPRRSPATGLYEPPGRPWLPHLTVARFRRPGHPFPLQNVNIPEFGVVRMVLYSSLLERAGAVHTPLAVFPAS